MAELAGGRRRGNTGRQRGDGLYFPRELLLHGGRQGLELAGLPLLGPAAGELHRGQGVQGVVVGRRKGGGEMGEDFEKDITAPP